MNTPPKYAHTPPQGNPQQPSNQGYYAYQQHPNWPPINDEPRHQKRRPRRLFLRFCRGYLMIAGGAVTIYAIIKWGVVLMVEINKWLPTQTFL